MQDAGAGHGAEHQSARKSDAQHGERRHGRYRHENRKLPERRLCHAPRRYDRLHRRAKQRKPGGQAEHNQQDAHHMHDRDPAHVGAELGRQRHDLRHRTGARTEQRRQRIPTVDQSEIPGGGSHHADRRDRRAAPRSTARWRFPWSVSGVTTAPSRMPTRMKHSRASDGGILIGASRESGDRNRQHRAGRPSRRESRSTLKANAACRRDEQRLRNVQEHRAVAGKERRHRRSGTLGSRERGSVPRSALGR